MADGIVVRCPECGSGVIYEKNTAYALLRVHAWEMDGEMPVPADRDTDVPANWESSEVQNQYVCLACDWEGSVDELRVDPPALPSPEEAPQ